MKFVKMHGLGNDFILFPPDTRCTDVNLSHLARAACHRNFGIGADGVILVMKEGTFDAPVKMRIFNSDGSEAEMCGNGIRCLARYVYEHGLVEDETFPVETACGVMTPRVLLRDGKVTGVRVDMGLPSFEHPGLPLPEKGHNRKEYEIQIDEMSFSFIPVSMGNPHAVIFELPENWPVYGAAIEGHLLFPHRTNVEFVRVVAPDLAEVRVWERGAGATLACGTGACAVLAAGVRKGILSRRSRIRLPGGELCVEWPSDASPVFMEGPAEEVFTGTINQEVWTQWTSPGE